MAVTIPPPARPGSLTVVVADDSPAARALLQATLRTRDGIEVVGVAADGRAAVELVAQKRPELVFLDIAMPEMDGLEAAGRIRALGLETKVIVFSAYTAEKMAAAARAAGADEYLEKAVSSEELFAAVQRLFPAARLRKTDRCAPAEGWPHDGPESPGEQRYRLLLDALDEGVVIVDGQGVVTSANFSAARILARPTSSILGRHVAELGLDDAADTNRLRRHPISAALTNGRPRSNVPVAVSAGDGHRRDLLLSARPLDVAGEATPAEVLVSFADVTSLRRSEERYRQAAQTLRHDKELLGRLFSAVHVLVAYLDRNFDFIRVNAAYAAADGREPDFFVGKNHFELYPNEENEEIFRTVVATGEPYVAYEKPFEYADHPERGVTYWDWNVRPVHGPDGDVEGVVLHLVDRTERVLVRKELETVRVGVTAMVDPMLMTTCQRDDRGIIRDFTVRYVNPAGLALVGKGEPDLRGSGLREVLWRAGGQQTFDACCRLVDTGEPLQAEVPWVDQHGIFRVFDVTVSTLGDGFLAVGRDITERRRFEELRNASDERFHTAVDLLPDALGIMTAVRDEGRIVDFEYVYANEAAVASLGMPAEDVIGRRLCELSPQMRSSGFFDLFRRVVETGEPLVVFAKPFEGTFDGRPLAGVFDVRARPLDDGFVVLWRDVTDRTQTLTALQDNDKRFRGALETMLDAVFLCEAVRGDSGHIVDLRYTFANPAAFDVRGRRVEDLVGRRMLELYPAMAGSELYAGYLRTIETGEPFRVEAFRYDDVIDGRAVSGVYDVQAVRHDDGVLVTYRQVAERDRLLAELRESRRVLEEAQRIAHIGSWAFDLERGASHIDCSAEMRRILGLPPDATPLSYAELRALLHPEDAAVTDAAFDQAIRQGEPFVFERRVMGPDGTIRTALVQGEPVRDASGLTVVVRGVIRDVTEERAAEAALAASEERFRLALDNLLDSITLVSAVRDHDGRVVDFHIDFANRAVLDVAGRGRDDIVGASFSGLYCNVRRSGLFDQLAHVVETGEPLVLDSYRYEDIDRSGRSVGAVYDIRAARLGDGCIVVWRDVSESWAAQEALRESEARFRLAAERAPIGMALVGIDGRFLLVNPALCELLGRSPAELTSTTFRRLTHPDDVREDVDLVDRTLAGEIEGYERDKRYVHRDGHVVWTHVIVALVRDRSGRPRHFYVQNVDIGERRRAEQQLAEAHAALENRAQELERANVELARANDELAEFAYVASHDLREPLRTVAGFAELLADRFGEQLDTEAAEFVAYIRQGVDRMQALIADLLAYSRVGTRPAPLTRVDVAELVDEVVSALHAKIDATGAEIAVGALPVVTADRVQLGQVFQNLLVNALTFVAPGVTPRITVTVERVPSAGSDGSEWRFVVADNGIGIRREQREKVFRMFQRLHASDRYPGSGMGLAICKRIVERHGGHIGVEDNPGGGTRFWFTLPATSVP